MQVLHINAALFIINCSFLIMKGTNYQRNINAYHVEMR